MSRSKQAFVSGLQANKAVAITPSDTNSINTQTSGLVDAVFLTATTAGNAVVTPSGNATGDVTIYLAQGVVHPLQVRHVKSTNTTASGIIGIWN